MRRRPAAAFATLAVLALVAAGCGSSDASSDAGSSKPSTTAGSSESPAESDVTIPEDAEPADGPDFDGVRVAAPDVQQGDDLNTVLLAAVDDQQQYWAATFPILYDADFTVIPPSRILALGPGDDSGGESCEGDSVTFENAEGNAVAFNCGEGQLVAWDTGGPILEAADANGPLASAAILAHEFGHVVQYQSGGELESPYSELQADCYAGSWVNAVSADPPAELEGFGDPAAVDATLSAVISLRDPVGYDAVDEDAHGNGFDRVRSFQDGFEKGAEECASYDEQPPTVTEAAFTDEAEATSGGNLALDELLPLVTADLDNYYGILVEGWEPLGTLKTSDLADSSPDELAALEELSDAHGDGAAMVFLGLGWASTLQTQVGADEGRDDTGLLLQAACVAGDWMGHLFFDVEGDETAGEISLSPGDLDEAMLALIEVYSGGDGSEGGGVFELISAYRQGVIGRLDACGL